MSNEPEWVSKFRSATLELDTAISEFVESNPSLNDLCIALVALNVAKSELAFVYEGLSSAVSRRMDQEKEVLLEDGSMIEKKWANDRRGWQHKELARVVADRLVQSSIDMETGEILYTQEELIANMLNFLNPSYWKVKELQNLGINADMYCEVGDTKTSLIVRKAKK